MDWQLALTILIPLFGFFAFIYSEIKGYREESRKEITSIRNEIQEQVKRSDRLYEMFIDLLKNQTPKSKRKNG